MREEQLVFEFSHKRYLSTSPLDDDRERFSYLPLNAKNIRGLSLFVDCRNNRENIVELTNESRAMKLFHTLARSSGDFFQPSDRKQESSRSETFSQSSSLQTKLLSIDLKFGAKMENEDGGTR